MRRGAGYTSLFPYTLTDMGQSFAPILHQMLAWSEAHLPPENTE